MPPTPPAPQPPWYADGLRFTCTQCGNCCGGAPGYVWVDDDDVRAIAEFRHETVDEFASIHVRPAGRRKSLRERANGDCVMLSRDADGKARCSIYPVRPLQCRTWPFWKSNVATADDWANAARGCPGMNKGAHHPLPVIQDALQRNEQAALPL